MSKELLQIVYFVLNQIVSKAKNYSLITFRLSDHGTVAHCKINHLFSSSTALAMLTALYGDL